MTREELRKLAKEVARDSREFGGAPSERAGRLAAGVLELLDTLKVRDTEDNGWVGWPDNKPPRYNACTDPCDMWTGPCACGAWHKDGK